MLNKTALSYRLKKSADITHREAALCVDALLEALIEGISKGERIELRGFGTFEVKPVKLRRTPFNNSIVPSHNRITFRPCGKLRNSVWNFRKG